MRENMNIPIQCNARQFSFYFLSIHCHNLGGFVTLFAYVLDCVNNITG